MELLQLLVYCLQLANLLVFALEAIICKFGLFSKLVLKVDKVLRDLGVCLPDNVGLSKDVLLLCLSLLSHLDHLILGLPQLILQLVSSHLCSSCQCLFVLQINSCLPSEVITAIFELLYKTLILLKEDLILFLETVVVRL